MALLVASSGCLGVKFDDSVTKIFHFVSSDVMKTGLLGVHCDVTRGMEEDG